MTYFTLNNIDWTYTPDSFNYLTTGESPITSCNSNFQIFGGPQIFGPLYWIAIQAGIPIPPHYSISFSFNFLRFGGWGLLLFGSITINFGSWMVTLSYFDGFTGGIFTNQASSCGSNSCVQTTIYATGISDNQNTISFSISGSGLSGVSWAISNFTINYLACYSTCLICSGPGQNQCSQCIPIGAFHSGGNTCLLCDSSCLNCVGSTNTDCTVCTLANPYKENFNGGKGSCLTACPSGQISDLNYNCINCPINCVQCQYGTPLRCISCYIGFYLTGVVCSPCDSSCLTCNGPANFNCLSCPTNIYLYMNTCFQSCPSGTVADNINFICLPCVYPCQTCSLLNQSLCGSCYSSYYLNGTNCFSCDISCSTCNGPLYNNCLSCPANNFLYLETCYNVCPVGTVSDAGNEICVPCSSSCQTCNLANTTQCLSCYNGNYLSNNSCLPCDGTCSTCNGGLNTNCNSCFISNFFYNNQCFQTCPAGTTQDSVNKICVSCPLNCQTCTLNNSIICTSCFPGTYLNNSICQYCDPTCGTCSGGLSNNCISCNINKFFYLQSCFSNCPNNTVADPFNKVCQRCSSPLCQLCSLENLNECQVCLDGYYPNNNICLMCDSSCLTCNGGLFNNCISCPGNSFLYANACYFNCPIGTIPDSTRKICIDCFSQCMTCFSSNPMQCLSCYDGFYLDSNYGCSACNSTCNTCENNPDYCLSCSSQLILFENQCIQNCPTDFPILFQRKCISSCPYMSYLVTQTKTCSITKILDFTTFEIEKNFIYQIDFKEKWIFLFDRMNEFLLISSDCETLNFTYNIKNEGNNSFYIYIDYITNEIPDNHSNLIFNFTINFNNSDKLYQLKKNNFTYSLSSKCKVDEFLDKNVLCQPKKQIDFSLSYTEYPYIISFQLSEDFNLTTDQINKSLSLQIENYDYQIDYNYTLSLVDETCQFRFQIIFTYKTAIFGRPKLSVKLFFEIKILYTLNLLQNDEVKSINLFDYYGLEQNDINTIKQNSEISSSASLAASSFIMACTLFSSSNSEGSTSFRGLMMIEIVFILKYIDINYPANLRIYFSESLKLIHAEELFYEFFKEENEIENNMFPLFYKVYRINPYFFNLTSDALIKWFIFIGFAYISWLLHFYFLKMVKNKTKPNILKRLIMRIVKEIYEWLVWQFVLIYFLMNQQEFLFYTLLSFKYPALVSESGKINFSLALIYGFFALLLYSYLGYVIKDYYSEKLKVQPETVTSINSSPRMTNYDNKIHNFSMIKTNKCSDNNTINMISNDEKINDGWEKMEYKSKNDVCEKTAMKSTSNEIWENMEEKLKDDLNEKTEIKSKNDHWEKMEYKSKNDVFDRTELRSEALISLKLNIPHIIKLKKNEEISIEDIPHKSNSISKSDDIEIFKTEKNQKMKNKRKNGIIPMKFKNKEDLDKIKEEELKDKNKEISNHKKNYEHYEFLMKDINYQTFFQRNFLLIDIIRQSLIVVIVVIIPRKPFLQIVLINFIQYLFLIFSFFIKPFKGILPNINFIGNELFITTIFICCLILGVYDISSLKNLNERIAIGEAIIFCNLIFRFYLLSMMLVGFIVDNICNKTKK